MMKPIPAKLLLDMLRELDDVEIDDKFTNDLLESIHYRLILNGQTLTEKQENILVDKFNAYIIKPASRMKNDYATCQVYSE